MFIFNKISSGGPGLFFVVALWMLICYALLNNLHTSWLRPYCLFFEQLASSIYKKYKVVLKGQFPNSSTGPCLSSVIYPQGFTPDSKSSRPDFRALLSGSVQRAGFLLGIFVVLSFANINAATIKSTASGGNWSSGTTWIGGVVPLNGDDVSIPAGSIVTIDANSIVSSLLVSGTLQFEVANPRSVTVLTQVSINSGGIFRSAQSGNVKNHQLIIQGSIINDGIIDFSSNSNATGVEIVFRGSGNAIFNCSDAPLTNLRQTNGIILDKGTSAASVLSFIPGKTFRILSDGSARAKGFLSIINGTFNIIGSNEFINPVFDTDGNYTIPATGGFWLGNQNATVIGMDGTATNLGDLKITNGTYQVGISGENSLENLNDGQLKMLGGVMNVGKLNIDGGICTIAGGEINLVTKPKSGVNEPSFYVSGQAKLEIYGNPVITIAYPNSKDVLVNDIQIQQGSGSKSITGGKIQLGTAVTPAQSNFLVSGEQILSHLTVFSECNINVFNTSRADLSNTSVSLLPKIVFDKIAPILTAPQKITIKCGDNLPKSYASLQEFITAGGTASDNCTLLPSSFKLVGQIQSSANCPYTITRTYEISDVSGNVGTAEHQIVVEGESITPQPEVIAENTVKEELKLKSAMAVYTATQNGNWNDPATWGGVGTPTSADDVNTASYTVTVNADSSCKNITIGAGGNLNHSGTNTLTVTGDWTNNGTYNAGTNGTIEFAGNAPATISGSAASNFYNFTLNKGSGISDIVSVANNIAISNLTFANGVLKMNAGTTSISDITNLYNTIPKTAGLVVSGGTLNTGNFSIENEGLIQVISGAANFGTNSGNSVHTQIDGAFIVSGGIVGIAGRLENTASGTLAPGVSSGISISNGTITLAKVGNGLSSVGSLNVTSAGTFNFSGGTIAFQNESAATTAIDLGLIGGSGAKTTIGGTFQFGNASTPAGTVFNISSEILLNNVTSSVNADLKLINDITIGTLALNPSTTIDLNGNALRLSASSPTTYNFPIDNGSGVPIPVTINLTGGSLGSNPYFEVKSFGTKFTPNNKSSVNFLNRYWTVTTSGITNPVYDVTATYADADVSGTESKIAMGSYGGSLPWVKYGNANAGANTLSATGITATIFTFTGITSDPPTVTATATPAAICLGSSSNLTATPVGDVPFTYSWSPGIGLSATNIANPVASPGATTTYTITVTDGNGFTATDATTVTVNPLPTATIGGTTSVCQNASAPNITFTGAVGVAPFKFTYTINGGSPLTVSTISGNSITVPAPTSITGTFAYSLVGVQDANLCTQPQSGTATITINTIPTVSAMPVTQTVCPGSNFSISVTNPNNVAGTTFTWTRDNTAILTGVGANGIGATISGVFNSTQPTTTQTTTFTIIATSPGGCSSQTTVSVTVVDNTPPVISGCPANISVNTGSGRITCNQTANWTEPTATDACGGVLTYTTRSHAPGTLFNVGTTTVTYTFKDASGNTSTCTFAVNVVDNTPPVKPTLPAITAQCSVTLTPPSTADNFAITPPTTTDNCSGTITGTTTTIFPYTATGVTSITWNFTDAVGNTTTATQLVTIQDATSPVFILASFPADKTLECNPTLDTSPNATGTPTATDNCSTVSITYTDNNIIIPGNCSGIYNIERTWKATDLAGKYVTKIQMIHIVDTKPPVSGCINFTVANPDEIPLSDEYMNVSFSDECGIQKIDLIDENYEGLGSGAGFCPSSVVRTYRATDCAGNTSTCTQTITVASPGTCQSCQSDVPFRFADLRGNPNARWTLDDNTARQGICCGVKQEPPGGPPRCMSFNVYLDKDAVGLIFTVERPGPSGSEFYQVDCGPKIPLGQVICLTGDRIYTVTFCKPGNDKPIYVIQSISGATTTEDITTRADANCVKNIVVTGLEQNSFLTWKVKFPTYANADTLLNRLSCTNCLNPTFTPNKYTPPTIVYEICGQVLGSYQCNATPIMDCAEVTVTTLPAITIELPIDLGNMCANNIIPIVANVQPISNYSFKWYDGPNGTGNLLPSTGPSWTPTINDEGDFSVVATEVVSVLPTCNSSISNFNLTFDRVGPQSLTVPNTLTLDCNLPATDFDFAVATWLASATASDTNVSSIPVSNDYTPFVHSCGAIKTVKFWADDVCGNTTSATAEIHVTDTTPPIITCPTAVTGGTDIGQCFATGVSLGTATALDNCSTVSVTNNAPAQFPVGVTTVTWTATDACGNVATCTQQVTILDNNQPPTVTCPIDYVEVIAADQCSKTGVSPGTPTVWDNCPNPTLTYTLTGATTGSGIGTVSNTTFNVGVTTVTYTVTDAAGSTNSCSFSVWIKRLDIPPAAITCPAIPAPVNAVAGTCSAPVILDSPIIVDPCNSILSVVHNSIYGTSASNASGSYPVGTTTVTWTITDNSGNIKTCTQTVTVNDTQPPFLTCPPDAIDQIVGGGCSLASGSVQTPTFSDNCGIASLTYVLSGATTLVSAATGINYANGITYNVGVTSVTYTVTDVNGLTASCTHTVWIKNLVAPKLTVTCPLTPITANASNTSCDALVTVPAPVINNPCNEVYTMVNDLTGTSTATGTFAVGTHTITWTVTDASGNKTTCTQTVIVTDILPPSLTCPPDAIDQIAGGGCSLVSGSVQTPTFSDNCGIASLTYVLSGATTLVSAATGINYANGVTYNVGVTSVTYTVTDVNGLTASCTHTVWIKNLVAPKLTVTCPLTPITANASNTSCDALVTVPAPVINNPCNEAYSMINNLTGTSTATGTFAVGTHTITWTVTDASGNINTCTQTVIVTDILPPSLTCPSDVIDQIAGGGCSLVSGSVQTPTFSDNCTIASLTYVLSGATTLVSAATGINYANGVTYNVGVTSVTYTVTDANGLSASCTHTVWIKNLAAPKLTVTCPVTPVTATASSTTCDAYVVVPSPGINNPCTETYTVTNSFNNTDDASDTYQIGTTTVTWTVIDASGNVTTCTQYVTVSDLPPTLTCPNNITDLADYELPYKDVVPVPEPAYGDNCPDPVLTFIMVDPLGNATLGNSDPLKNVVSSPSRFLVGVTSITYTVTDSNGNTTSCTFTVTILAKPDITCPNAISGNTDTGTCTYGIDPGVPTLNSGVQPITWTWTITNPDGTLGATGSSTTTNSSLIPEPIGIYDFEVGTSTITWRAENVSGFDECNQLVTVEDKEPPTFTLPLSFSECVERIQDATFDAPTNDITPTRPEYYVLEPGDISLDLTGLWDNCCATASLTVNWRIEFTDPSNPSGSPTSTLVGTGQLSMYTTPILFPGDGVTFLDVVHHVFYWVEDCHGNKTTPEQSFDVTIRPRPEIIKMN